MNLFLFLKGDRGHPGPPGLRGSDGASVSYVYLYHLFMGILSVVIADWNMFTKLCLRHFYFTIPIDFHVHASFNLI